MERYYEINDVFASNVLLLQAFTKEQADSYFLTYKLMKEKEEVSLIKSIIRKPKKVTLK